MKPRPAWRKFLRSLRILGGVAYLLVLPHLLSIKETSTESKFFLAAMGLFIVVDTIDMVIEWRKGWKE